MEKETIIQEELPQGEEKATQEEKTFTREEVTNLIKANVDRAVAKAYKDAQQQADEVEKLKAMNYEQKAEYEKEKAEKKIKELENELNKKGLEYEAIKMLQKEGITATPEILEFVVKNDAENTQKSLTALINLVNELVGERISKGKTPSKVYNEITKEDFEKLTYTQKAELFSKNQRLYNELKGK